MSLLRNKYPKIREKRLNTINSYFGDIDTLLNEIKEENHKQRLRTFSQGEEDEIIYALEFLSTIGNSISIIHGPSGCLASGISKFSRNRENVWFSSNILEKDSILGGDRKLKETIRKAYKKYTPELIFILTTPVVAINNDDIEGVIKELSEEVEAKIIPIYTDGFKSKIASYGYDLAFHGIAKYLINNSEIGEKERYINLISISEDLRDVEEIISLTKSLGVEVNLIPRFSNANSLKASANALFSIALNESEGEYVGRVLEEEFNVPFVRISKPIGVSGIENYIKELLKNANRIIDLDNLTLLNKYKHLESRKILKGFKVYVNTSQSTSIEILTIIKNLGGEIVGLTVKDINQDDTKYLENIKSFNNEIKIHVGNGQVFEEINILQKLSPDIYISDSNKSKIESYTLIPSISLDLVGKYGYRALERLISTIKRQLSYNIKYKQEEFIYKNGWLKKNPNWYVKQEVK
ncbi:nitrogenase component 1 [Clostridium cylindrosporum]|uniref:Nitrogenase iron-molybdenum cofactor biosynthesis protein NifE n=1 Tax=Clostridium cylindrosporum DSM 605 TaxID=1121307 RepID=A0A0J8D9G6_CLOCY|nr:nitrogenase component 1 [Clostridium cylindrosporum]KMT20964.1 nitrogenase iron-molybdenum cofactor biosynthesis protein NifE [Clostridium cylindrosporum DSM 605]